MNTIQAQIDAALAARDRIEIEAWDRAGFDVPCPSDREQRSPYISYLGELMTVDEQRRWRSIGLAIGQLQHYA